MDLCSCHFTRMRVHGAFLVPAGIVSLGHLVEAFAPDCAMNAPGCPCGGSADPVSIPDLVRIGLVYEHNS
jgi:hypothetical protein